MILKTERLTLRPLQAEDAAAMHLMMSDAEVMAFWDSEVDRRSGADRTTSSQRQLDEAARDEAPLLDHGAGGGRRLPRRAATSPRSTGAISRAEVGFMVARRLLGRRLYVRGHACGDRPRRPGPAAEAAAARAPIWAMSAPCACSSGWAFKREGLLRGYVERDGERRDCVLFGLLL